MISVLMSQTGGVGPVSAGCTELTAVLPSCYIKFWQCGEAAEGSPTDSHKNEGEGHRNGETEIPRKQAYSLALGGGGSLMAAVLKV